MVNQEVDYTLYDIKQWAEAYKILVEWHNQKCGDNAECSKCGFNAQCAKATNLTSR